MKFHDVVVFWMGFHNCKIICSKHTMPGQVGFVMKKKFCHETFLTSSRGILIARNFSKEKKYSYVREWSNFCIGESSSDFFNIPTWNASLVVATQFRRGYVLTANILYCKAIYYRLVLMRSTYYFFHKIDNQLIKSLRITCNII